MVGAVTVEHPHRRQLRLRLKLQDSQLNGLPGRSRSLKILRAVRGQVPRKGRKITYRSLKA